MALVVLRMAIGWLFFAGAWQKYYNKSFSSIAFLQQAKGPLAWLYQAWLPDPHGWKKFIEEPRQQRPSPSGKSPSETGSGKSAESSSADQNKSRELADGPYQRWMLQIEQDWAADRQQIVDHFKFKEDQKAKAAQRLAAYDGNLQDYLAKHADELAGFRNDLYRLARSKPQPELPADPDLEQRRVAALAVGKWVDQTETALHGELDELVTPAQRTAAGPIEVPESSIHRFDRFLLYSHMAIGGCLLIGLLTRLASLGASLFLFSVVASQPPWSEGALPWLNGQQAVMYQMVMLLACLVLMTTGAGRWAGLDYFFVRRGSASKSA